MMVGKPPILTKEQCDIILHARAMRNFYTIKQVARRLGVSPRIVNYYSYKAPKRYLRPDV